MQADAPPAGAVTVFGANMPKASAYAALLANAGIERGLIGPQEVPRLWERHILNCAVIETLIPVESAVADIGSGAGLPGVPLAIARSDLSVILVEPLLRRMKFLEDAVSELSLSNVSVERSRAENMAQSRSFDVVTARAVAPMDRLAGWTLALVRPGGCLLAIKGVSAAEELENASGALRRARARTWEVATVGDDVLETPTRVAVVRK